MAYDDILAQVLDLLQRQGRVSYRALKRRFNLDDGYIEDLKAELIDAQEERRPYRRVALPHRARLRFRTERSVVPLIACRAWKGGGRETCQLCVSYVNERFCANVAYTL